MRISRRSFLGLGAAGMVSYLGRSLLAQSPTATDAPDRPAPVDGSIGQQRFVSHIGSEFELRDGAARSARTTLDEVLERAPSSRDQVRVTGESFSLLFAASPDQDRLDQGNYDVVHATLGSFPAFVVPVGRGHKAQDYEIIFNGHVPSIPSQLTRTGSNDV